MWVVKDSEGFYLDAPWSWCVFLEDAIKYTHREDAENAAAYYAVPGIATVEPCSYPDGGTVAPEHRAMNCGALKPL